MRIMMTRRQRAAMFSLVAVLTITVFVGILRGTDSRVMDDFKATANAVSGGMLSEEEAEYHQGKEVPDGVIAPLDGRARFGDSIAQAGGDYGNIVYDDGEYEWDGTPAPMLNIDELRAALKANRKTDYKPGVKIENDPLYGYQLDNEEHTSPLEAPLPRGYQGAMTNKYRPYEQFRVVKKNYGNRKKVPKATFFTIVRNHELENILGSMQQMEARFNKRFNYDWVFVNDVPFTDEFIEKVSAMASGTTRFGIIPHEHWSYPSYVDQKRAAAYRASPEAKGMLYGDSESYRFMCRYNSRYFYKHPIMDEYKYYWRVEPDVTYQCDIVEDPIRYLKETGTLYGFTIAFLEYPLTVKSLWDVAKEYLWKEEIRAKQPEDNLLPFVSDNNGENYNFCHYWTNFEIADLDIWRNDVYEGFVDHLDRSGGFFYERWGDAPVHSIFASVMLPRKKTHMFQDISYQHTIATTCPLDDEFYRRAHCTCNQNSDFTISSPMDCARKYLEVSGEPLMRDFQAHMNQIGRPALQQKVREPMKPEDLLQKKAEIEQKLEQQRVDERKKIEQKQKEKAGGDDLVQMGNVEPEDENIAKAEAEAEGALAVAEE